VADGLLAHGEDIVAGLLRENVDRWETLSAADRVRVERLARRIAERLLREPALVLDAAERAGDEGRVRLARSLFGLSPHAARTSSRTLCA
jgi:glutamyl-tRNA reductase